MKNRLKKLSTEELKKQKSSLQIVVGILAGLVLVLLILSILKYSKTNEFFHPQMMVTLSLLAIVILYFIRINKITSEIKSREQ